MGKSLISVINNEMLDSLSDLPQEYTKMYISGYICVQTCICCGSKVVLVSKFSSQFDSYFPLSQIMVLNAAQRKKIKIV